MDKDELSDLNAEKFRMTEIISILEVLPAKLLAICTGNTFLELNFDGSVALQKAGAGFVVRNENGHTLGVGAFNLDGATISATEARAWKDGLAYSLWKGFSHIMVEGDTSLTIQVVLGSCSVP